MGFFSKVLGGAKKLLGTTVGGTIGGALLGGGLDFLGGERKMSFESREAQKMRDYQTDMSNTSVQRRMADMRAAGINPIMAAGTGGMSGGASTPSGAKGTGHAVSYSSSALALKKNVEEINNLKATGNLIRANEDLTREKEILTAQDRKLRQDELIFNRYRFPGAKTEGDIDKSWYGKGFRWFNRVPMPLVPKLNMYQKGR